MQQPQRMIPHSCMVDKNQKGYVNSEWSQTQARPHSPGFQHWENKSPQVSAFETNGGWGSWRNCQIIRKLHWKGQNYLKTYTNTPTLGFTTKATAGREPLAYGEWVKWLEMGRVLGKPPESRQQHCPLPSPPPHTEPQSGEVGCPSLMIT